MIALGFRVPLISLIAVGLAACSAAGQSPPMGTGHGDDSGAAPSAQQGSDRLDLPPSPSAPEGSDMHANGNSGDSKGDGSGDASGSCTCGVHVPGVDIVQGDTGIRVLVDLPGDGSMIIATVDGHVTTSEAGVDITGDVDVDLGGNDSIALADGKLHIDAGVNGSIPTLSGSADISGALLGGACGCDDEQLPATVWLDADVDLDADETSNIALGVGVDLPHLVIDGSALAQANGDLTIGDAHVVLDTDGSHDAMTITGELGGTQAPWTSSVPLQADGKLQATAQLIDQTLVTVQLTGAATLKGDSLWCGITPLTSVKLDDAKVTLDGASTSLEATSNVSLHSGYLLDGTARITATFEQHDWSINVCGAVMTKLLGSSADAATCLDLSHEGVKTCPGKGPN